MPVDDDLLLADVPGDPPAVRGYRPTFFTGPARALESLGHDECYDLPITGEPTTQPYGGEPIRRVRCARPRLPGILPGDRGECSDPSSAPGTPVAVLRKPFSADEHAETLSEAFDPLEHCTCGEHMGD